MGRFHRHPDGTVHTHEHAADHDHDDHGQLHDHPHSHDTEHRDVGDHSAYETSVERVAVLESILGENDRMADQNRALFASNGIRAVNVMSSPGAGKTSLLKRTLPVLRDEMRVGVVEGDIATSIDADALTGLGAEISLINTDAGFGGECHLDATMVRAGLRGLTLPELDLVLIENVGNLVCPAEFDVGQTARAMVFSVTEGEEKPLKYPVMFRAVDAVVVNKVDLLPYLDFDMPLFLQNVQSVNPGVTVINVSAKTGEGVDVWVDWLRGVNS